MSYLLLIKARDDDNFSVSLFEREGRRAWKVTDWSGHNRAITIYGTAYALIRLLDEDHAWDLFLRSLKGARIDRPPLVAGLLSPRLSGVELIDRVQWLAAQQEGLLPWAWRFDVVGNDNRPRSCRLRPAGRKPCNE